jgi:hypothetical protein
MRRRKRRTSMTARTTGRRPGRKLKRSRNNTISSSLRCTGNNERGRSKRAITRRRGEIFKNKSSLRRKTKVR